jgi:tetratricopeptide (TPR) repeat protein
LDDGPRARVLHAAAVLAAAQDDHTAAHELAAHSLAFADAAGDRYATAQAGNALGIAAMTAGELDRAREHFRASLTVWQELDDQVGLAMAHGNLTMVALRLGTLDVARYHATQCLRLERAQGNLRGIMLGLLCLGEIELHQGEAATAGGYFEEARALARGVGDVFGEAMALHKLGLVALRSGDRAAAVRQVSAALLLRHDADDRGDLAESLETLADLVGVEGQAPRIAARLVGAAQALRARYQLPPGPETVPTRLAQLLAREDLDAALATGRAAPLDTIIDEALDALR